MLTLPSYFLRHISPEPNSGCWIWTSCLDKDGYALGARNKNCKPRTVRAHRAIYKLLVGPIAEGLTLDHLCKTKCCVNPDHLEPVTSKVNILRGNGRAAVNARKTHCPRGHSLAEHAYINKKQQRICRICQNAAEVRYKERKRLGIKL